MHYLLRNLLEKSTKLRGIRDESLFLKTTIYAKTERGGLAMEAEIVNLDEKTDPATKKMLQNLIERKKKFDRYKSRHLMSVWVTIGLISIYFYYLYITVMKPYSYSFAEIFSVYVQNSANLYFLILTVGTYGLMILFKEKREKAEKEYHALRCEIVDRSKDLWKKEEEWKNRHIVFEMMKKSFDINLYHENK
jgi:hypothetical protein